MVKGIVDGNIGGENPELKAQNDLAASKSGDAALRERSPSNTVRPEHAELERLIEARTAELQSLNRSLQAAHDDQRRSAETLLANWRLLRLFVEHVPAPIAMLDRDMRYVVVSRRWLTDYSLEARDLIGRSHYDVFPEISERWKEVHRRCLAGAIEKCHEDPFPRADGSVEWLHWEVHPWLTEEGKTAGIIIFSENITERKRKDEQVLALNAELLERVSARTAELREREAMVQEIHHRVRNNLQVISSLINMQVRTLKDAASRSALEECRARVQTMALIHEALYESQDYARVAFSEYAKKLARNIFDAARVSEGTIALDLEFDEISLPVQQAIPCALILNELISNALKHAFPGATDGAIRVELQADSHIVLSVADNGIGLSPDFDLEKPGSLGMLLLVTLVEQLGGRLEIIRQPGATFRVTIPATSAA